MRKSIPELGVEFIANTGDNLYTQYKVVHSTTTDAVLEAPAIGRMEPGHTIYLLPQKRGRLANTKEGYKAVCWDNATSGVLGRLHACLVDTKNAGKFDSSMFANRDRLFPLDTPVPYRTVESTSEAIVSDSFKREALFEGVSKGTLKISFREFLNDMARPVFTQDVLYDLNSDGTVEVVFKGLKLKVSSASGSTIKYEVRQPFND